MALLAKPQTLKLQNIFNVYINYTYTLQSNEVKNATWCELEGLKRIVEFLQQHQLEVNSIITDRHKQVNKWIRENMEGTRHYYDMACCQKWVQN